jgi:hypothetical protein
VAYLLFDWYHIEPQTFAFLICKSDSGVRVVFIRMPLKNLAFVVTAVDLEMCVVMKTVKIDHNKYVGTLDL